MMDYIKDMKIRKLNHLNSIAHIFVLGLLGKEENFSDEKRGI